MMAHDRLSNNPLFPVRLPPTFFIPHVEPLLVLIIPKRLLYMFTNKANSVFHEGI